MSFDVPGESYDRFMGRFSRPLATQFADLARIRRGRRALDVGSGTGALTAELVGRLGAPSVSAVDPSASFVADLRRRMPAVDVQESAAENLPYPDSTFDSTLAQLVVHFMPDPVAGIREMARVTRSGGTVAACVWDHGGGQGPLGMFWRAARDLDPQVHDESGLPGVHDGELRTFLRDAGLVEPRQEALIVTASYAGLEEWWQTYLLGVGPAGGYVAGLDAGQQSALRERCAELLPDGPFTVSATAWAAVGTV